jgi:superfamily II DNA helicase RecQ
LQEYVELCRGIIEGRPPAEALKPSKASKASKLAKTKKSKSSSIPPISQNPEEAPKLKKRGRKPKLKEEPIIIVPAEPKDLPKPSIPISADSEAAPIKPKRATSTKEMPSEPIVMATEIPTLPITENQQPPRELPPNWQHDFEQDLSPIRTRMETLLHDFDHSLREESKFDQHAPLGFLPLRFWQSRFDWDEQVEKAAKKYIMSAATSKQQLDPSFKASAKDEDASVPVSFKPLQREAINIALARRNVFVALPTGGGKTMVYVLPSLLEPGITVVISPLIALIQDQVTLLESMGIGAAGISCQMSPEQLEKVYDELLSTNGPSRFKLIYVTPERIGRNERFVKILTELDKRGSLQRVVVDEAHCISEWGHDFRRDYRRLKVLKEFMPSLPIMALTGTCTAAVRKDIAEQLGIALPKKESKRRDSKVKITEGAADKANRPIPHYNLEDILEESIPAGDVNGHYVLQTSFNRPNLWFQISSKSSETPMGDMLYYILNQGLAHECGIIYAMTTSDAERLADFFAQQGLLTTFYHGGMTPQARQEAHAQWARGQAKLMCTTVAFGLGIDKSNVRYVLHSTMPTSLEAYYQQAGRAGRDGNPADCVMFFDPKDRMRIEFVIKLNAHFLRQRERKAELAKQQQKLLEIQKQEIETLAKSKGLKSKKPSSSEPSTSPLTGSTADSPTVTSPDSDLSIVDIVDIGDSSGPGGNVRLVNEDGTEYFFEGFHPDYTGLTGVEKGEYEEEDPLDAFVRQMKTEKLDDVTSYAREKRTCRRVHLMRFFGQKFVSHQCEHSCDNCHPSARRITDKLTKRGKEEWESLAPQREARIALMKEGSSRPLTPAVAKIHDLIHVQEQEMAREAEAEARKAEEEEYERQFDKGTRKRGSKRPAIPSKIGSSSPLAKKLRKGRSLSSLGDPSEYALFEERLQEDLEAASRRKTRKPATSLDAPSSHPTPTSDLVAPLLTSTTIHESPIISRPTIDTLDSSENMQELLARIAEVTERKALRRQQSLSKKRGTSFSTKRHVIQQQDEDGYIRTRTLIPEAYGAGDSMDEIDEFVPPPLPPPPEPVLTEPAQLSLSSQLQSNEAEEDPDDDELGEAVENARTATAEDKISSSRLNHKLLIDIRQACRRISNEKGILPQSVMSQKTMKELVKARPKTVLQLASIKGVGPGRARRYASLLLPLFEGIDDL